MLLGSNGGGGGGPAPCESTTVLQTEAWFIGSQNKAAEVGRMEKIIPTKQKQKMLIPLFTTLETGSQRGSGSDPQLY